MAIPASRFVSAMVMTWNLDIFLDVSLQNGTVAGNLLFACLFVLCVCTVWETLLFWVFVGCLFIGRIFFFFFESVVIRGGLVLLGLLGKLLVGGKQGMFIGKCVNCFIGGLNVWATKSSVNISKGLAF